MCTLTWRRNGAATFEIFFNRDEKKTRSRAEPPTLREARGMRFLAPRDPDGGGTWMLVNQRALVVCLLNRWHEEAAPASSTTTSRGRLVWDLATCENVPAVAERLQSSDPSGARPFSLAAFDPVGQRGWDWNGRELTPVRLEMPVCSSSFHFEEVAAARRARFNDLRFSARASRDFLEAFHSDTTGGPNAFTVRMCRADAQTMSRSHLLVEEDAVRWSYLEEPPNLEGEPRHVVAEFRLAD